MTPFALRIPFGPTPVAINWVMDEHANVLWAKA